MPDQQQPVNYIRPVLVVEDDHQLADLLSEVLVLENCAADIAANGMEAMEKLRAADYEAVICDLMMPRVDGEAFYHQAVRQYPFLAEKFVFITGEIARRAGLSEFVHRSGCTLLEKPFDIEQLRAAMREVFAR
jgi:DNA-binding response OmpR family regulator